MTDVINSLNAKYGMVLKRKNSISEAYTEMVKQHPYRVLSAYSYDYEEKSLSQSGVDPPPVTDAGSDDQVFEKEKKQKRGVHLPGPLNNISLISEHIEFIQMVINAKTSAQLDNKDVEIVWRNYSLSVSPDFDLTKENVTKELLSALQSLVSLSETEEKVFIEKWFVSFNFFFFFP